MKSSRRAARKLRPPPFLGVPSVIPGGRSTRSIATTFAVALALVVVIATTWTSEVAAHAAAHPSRCIDVPVAIHSSTDCWGVSARAEVAVVPSANAASVEYRIKGETYDLGDLRRYLQSMAEVWRESDEPEAPSALWLVIRADRTTPWQHIGALLNVCMDPDIRIYKTQFVVRSEGSRPCSYAASPDLTDLTDPITTYVQEQLR